MILRQLVSTFLIQAMLITSAGAYTPKSPAVFLLNEGRRELRCQLTPDNIELFSTEEFQGLAQNGALATVDSSANELRPCDEDDVFYAQIVFGEVSRASVATPGEKLIGAGIMAVILLTGTIITLEKILKKRARERQKAREETDCGEIPLDRKNRIQCLDDLREIAFEFN